MKDDLDRIRGLLREGLNLSQQGSYGRRAPSPKALPLLRQARDDLEAWVAQNGENVEALRSLALAEEALLNYDGAAHLLQKVISLSPQADRKDLKRLAACREAGHLWSQLALSPRELAELGLYLKGKLLDNVPERSLRWTETWLHQTKPDEKQAILASIRRLGYFSDYDVLHNLVAA